MDLDGKSYRQRYERGKAVMPLTEVGTAERTGSTVTFLPDDTIFEETVFDYDILKERLRETAFLTKGLKINLTDKREEQERTKTFHYKMCSTFRCNNIINKAVAAFRIGIIMLDCNFDIGFVLLALTVYNFRVKRRAPPV